MCGGVRGVRGMYGGLCELCVGCVGVSVSTPAPGHGCQRRSGATVWQLLDPRARQEQALPGHVPVQTLRARLLLGAHRALSKPGLGPVTSRKGGWDLCNPEPCSDMTLLVFPSQFEMLTGALPFQGKDRKETMTLILK